MALGQNVTSTTQNGSNGKIISREIGLWGVVCEDTDHGEGNTDHGEGMNQNSPLFYCFSEKLP